MNWLRSLWVALGLLGENVRYRYQERQTRKTRLLDLIPLLKKRVEL